MGAFPSVRELGFRCGGRLFLFSFMLEEDHPRRAKRLNNAGRFIAKRIERGELSSYGELLAMIESSYLSLGRCVEHDKCRKAYASLGHVYKPLKMMVDFNNESVEERNVRHVRG